MALFFCFEKPPKTVPKPPVLKPEPPNRRFETGNKPVFPVSVSVSVLGGYKTETDGLEPKPEPNRTGATSTIHKIPYLMETPREKRKLDQL